MSTVQVSNIHFESTGNNRIQVEGSNVSVYQAGQTLLTANNTDITFSNGTGTFVVGQSTTITSSSVPVGQYIVSANSTTPTGYVRANTLISKTEYANLYSTLGSPPWKALNWKAISLSNTTVYPSRSSFIFGNNLFLIADTLGSKALQLSTDAITWSNGSINSATSYNFRTNALGYGNGVYIAVGLPNTSTFSSYVDYSTDAITWSSVQLTGTTNTSLTDVAYGNGIFVAVGVDKSTDANGVIYRSTNGSTWTHATSYSNTSVFNGVAYGNGLFIAIGPVQPLVSTNGLTWTVGGTGVSNPSSIIYANNTFYLMSNSSSIVQSTNGTTWASFATLFPTGGWFETLAYGNGYFLVSGYRSSFAAGLFAATSSDGINWFAPPANYLSKTTRNMIYVNGTFYSSPSTFNSNTTTGLAAEIYSSSFADFSAPLPSWWESNLSSNTFNVYVKV